MISHIDTQTALARELELLTEAQSAPDLRFLWIWQGSRCLVAPRKLGVLPRFLSAQAELKAAGWPVYLRATGGDATPQGPGILNVTHVYTRPANQRFDMDDEYYQICGPIERALGSGASRGWQPGAFCDGAHNVQWQGRKFAGTAMRLRPSKPDKSRLTVLAHALMLMEPPSDAAIGAINRFLHALGQEREIRADAHIGLPDGVTPDSFVQRLSAEFQRLAPESDKLHLLSPQDALDN